MPAFVTLVVKVIGEYGPTFTPGFAVMAAVGFSNGFTVIVMPVLVAVGMARHVALLVSWQVITSLFANEVLTKVLLFVPAFTPFTFH